jgi:hypothetical protein
VDAEHDDAAGQRIKRPERAGVWGAASGASVPFDAVRQHEPLHVVGRLLVDALLRPSAALFDWETVWLRTLSILST